MKKLVYLLMIIYTASGSAQDNYIKKSIDNLKKSNLFITGSTNVSTFTCEFNTEYLQECQEILYVENDGNFDFKEAILVLNIKEFDCGSQAINRDFNKLIKSDIYTEISLEVKSAEVVSSGVNATVIIGMAGKIREYEVPVDITNTSTTHFKGVLQIKLSDYELKLPKKLFGLIEVKDKIEIHFDISASYDHNILH